jgi:hypothetical protein
VADDDGALFAVPDVAVVPVPEPLSADARRTRRQTATLAAGWHPLGPKLHPQAAPADDRTAAGRRCGTCWYRKVVNAGHAGTFPKCHFGALNPTDTDPRPGRPPRASNSAATDCRAWWPACVDHTWADPGIDDAARWVPEPGAVA